ncbi:hypothetical protein [Pandoraea commovens]|uniref:Tail fiber protein n=1 Tax=Pandoraea commovens TaxID=2508289 RepID=A0ABY5QI30_9BURK|nr:hypothetical protein [Pandoraea commovens]UVA80471.1 hypothetical protein NTU39_05460 [Pandoraea commovens]
MASLKKVVVGIRDDGKDGDSNRVASLKHNGNVDALSGQLPLSSSDVIKAPQALTVDHLGKRVNINLAAAGGVSMPRAADCPFDSVILLRNVGASAVTLSPAPGSADAVTLSSLLPGESVVMDTDGVATWAGLIRSRSTSVDEATLGKQLAVNAPNLLYNGSGEFGADGWSSWPTQLGVLTDSRGTYFSAAPNAVVGTSYWTSPLFRVTGGVPHTIQGEILVDAQSTGDFYIDVVYYSTTDGTGAVLLDGSNFSRSRTSLGTWQFVSGTDLNVPAGAQSARLRAVAAGATWNTFQFRRLKVEAGASASSYSLEASIAKMAASFGGRLIGIRVLTASGTYNSTPGTKSVIADIQAAGGAGGGTPAGTPGVSMALGGAGGGGGFIRHRFTSDFDGLAYTVGAGGVGVAGAAGGPGGNSTFGTLIARGGFGGSTASVGNISAFIALAGAGGQATGGNILNVPGNPGGQSMAVNTACLITGLGGASQLGAGGAGALNGNGNPGGGYGGGGGGIWASNTPAYVGGKGADGVIIVYEFA